VSVGPRAVRTMPRMCAVGSSQETSIAATTPAGVGGSMRESAGPGATGARRVAGGRARGTLLTGAGFEGGGSLLTGSPMPGPGRPAITMER
jgi:hypothetical protein